MKPTTTPQDKDPRMVRVLYEGKEKYISENLARDPQFMRENNIRLMPKAEPVQTFATKQVAEEVTQEVDSVESTEEEETPKQNKGGRPRKN